MIKWYNEKKRIEVAEIDEMTGEYLIDAVIPEDRFNGKKHIKVKPPKNLKNRNGIR
ncbi:hypothetical protein [Tepidibacillus fermentans]|uniref:Uncharacterized protein n=1 Tax=Tepidibacillus fermentans TaxID=1281767 RepID=A0A4R3KBF1_9BACI|nr:hypothetical protein [Tepidibacillus fermentans]TCS80387.1 hypothetical protein EDD72_11754 [Tepidibacillus fermentans]